MDTSIVSLLKIWVRIYMGKQIMRLYFGGLQNHCRLTAAMKLKDACTLGKEKKNFDQFRQHIKKQRYYFANKGPSSQGYGFSSGHVWM